MPALGKKTGINLLIDKEANESFPNQILSWVFTYGRYIIIITQIIVLSVFFARFKLDQDHTDLKEAVSQKQAIIESVADLETEIRRVQKKLSHIRETIVNQDINIKILRFLQENTPSDMVFSTLSISPEKISFSAIAKSLHSFSFLLSKLQQDNKFSDVSLEDINRKSDGRVEFKINANINQKGFTKE